MLFHKNNTGKRLAALTLCGLFVLQTPAVPAMAARQNPFFFISNLSVDRT